MTLLAVSTLSHLFNLAIMFLGVILIFMIVVLQRGKGGGLAGVFGGAGGSSALGARDTDKITKWTGYLGLLWICLLIGHVLVVKADSSSVTALDQPGSAAPVDTSDTPFGK